MIPKDLDVDTDLSHLPRRNPRLYSLLHAADGALKDMFDKELVVTSIHRTHLDRNGIHAVWRAADIGVMHVGIPADAIFKRLSIDEALWLVTWINDTFAYGRKWNGQVSQTAHFRQPQEGQDDTAVHVHLQVKGFGIWK